MECPSFNPVGMAFILPFELTLTSILGFTLPRTTREPMTRKAVAAIRSTWLPFDATEEPVILLRDRVSQSDSCDQGTFMSEPIFSTGDEDAPKHRTEPENSNTTFPLVHEYKTEDLRPPVTSELHIQRALPFTRMAVLGLKK